MNDDERSRVREEYGRARENGRLALVLVPILIVATMVWVVVHPEYQPGDWRGDLAMRARFGLVAIGLFTAFGVLAAQRRTAAARRASVGKECRPVESGNGRGVLGGLSEAAPQ